jgi:hypothetical protein
VGIKRGGCIMRRTLSIFALLVAISLVFGACKSLPNYPSDDGTSPEASSPEPATFELKGWEVVDDGGVASLQISFSATNDLELLLTDPAGVEVDWDYTEFGVTGARLRLAGYGETPPAGRYTLLVKRFLDELVDSVTFDFEGARLEVIDVDTFWEYYEYEFIDDYYSLEVIDISVINHGDLPAYIDEVELRLDGEIDRLYFFDGVLLPGQQETFTESTFLYDIEPGEYELRLKLEDSAGQTLATYSITVWPHE